MTISKFSLRALGMLACLAFCIFTANAQNKASLQGTVLDPKGTTVVGAKVTVTNQETGVSRDAVTSGEGFYRVGELPPGKYTIVIAAPGFKESVTKDVIVEAEQPRGLDVTLAMGAVTEQVTVTANAGEHAQRGVAGVLVFLGRGARPGPRRLVGAGTLVPGRVRDR